MTPPILTIKFNQDIKSQDSSFLTYYQQFVDNLQHNNEYQFLNRSVEQMMLETTDLYKVANHLDKFSTILLVGLGGAINNPRAVIEYLAPQNRRFLYLDTIDPVAVEQLFSQLDFNDTGVLFISKSGSTLETNVLAHAIKDSFQQRDITMLHQHFVFITSSLSSELSAFADEISAMRLPHADIGGRFAAFSNIVFLPLILAGYAIEEFCNGGISILTDMHQTKENSVVAKSLAFFQHNKKADLKVTISYDSQLCGYLEWYDQIFAESLGKEGFNITPLSAIAPQVQHSQLQLYLGGKDNKIFTVITSDNVDNKQIYANKSLQELVMLQSQALVNTFTQAGLDCRMMNIAKRSPYHIGYLMMHSMLEVIMLAIGYNLNPFDQPQVEQMKMEVMQNLEKNY